LVPQRSPLVELRRYTLKPGRRDELRALFDAHFTRGQEQLCIQGFGPFHDDDAPDQLVWLRAFEDLASRHRALTGFYFGPVWAAHGPAANDTMVDSDNVHLLEPFPTGRGLATPFAGTNAPGSQTCVAVLQHRGGGVPHADEIGCRVSEALARTGAGTTVWFRTSSLPNTFTRLPVRRDQALVCVSESAGPVPVADVRAAASAALADLQGGSDWHADVTRLVSGDQG
jgi:hypothetical protein